LVGTNRKCYGDNSDPPGQDKIRQNIRNATNYCYKKIFISVYGHISQKFQRMAHLDICKLLHVLSDDKVITIFNTIAFGNDIATIPASRLELTRKQYYSRMSAMTDAGLITRRSGRYFLTSLGKVVYQAQILIGKAQQDYWKLKAIDSIESSTNALTLEERDRFINSLIADNDLKEILLSSSKENNDQELIALQQQSLD
jgi:hypothetical protein